MTKFLFLAQHFPPIGGAGVQRSLAFVKHLASCGFKPLVLTGEGKATSRWTPEDESLRAQLPETTTIFRTEATCRNGSQRKTNTSRLELRAGLIALGSKVIREHRPTLVFVTMSPFDDAYVASELSRRHKLPWIADLRDPWAFDEFQVYRSFFHRLRERRRMQRVMRSASLVVMNTPEAARRIASAFPQLKQRVVTITNGFDADDFSGPPPPQPDYFTIVHAGFLHTQAGLHQKKHRWQYRILGRAERGVSLLPRSHYYLLQALEKWYLADPSIGQKVKLLLVGAPTAADRELAGRSLVAPMVEFTGYVTHSESLHCVRSANLLFLPMHTMPRGQRATIVPGKTYEYMASGRPILAAVPDGDAKDFLTRCGTAKVCEPDDVEAMVALLKDAFRRWQNRTDSTGNWNKSFVEQFERRRLTSLLADELNRVLARSSN